MDHLEPNATPPPSGLNPVTSLLVAVGSGLIFIGILFLIYTSWDQFAPAGRVATVLLPLAFLYGVAAYCRRRPAFRRLSGQVMLGANLILPPVIGILLYQLNLYRPNDAGLVLLALLFSLPVVLLSEYLLGLQEQAYLLGLYSVLAWLCAVVQYDLRQLPAFLILAGIGLVFLVLGAPQLANPLTSERRTHTTIGASLVGLGLLLYPFGAQGASDAPFSFLQIGLFALSALAYFLLAVFFAYLWKVHRDDNLAQVRIVFENAVPLALVGPVTLSAIASDNFGYTALLLLFSLVLIVASYSIAVRFFRAAGWFGLVVAIIPIFSTLFRQLSVYWPVALVGAGMLLVAVSLALTHFEAKNLLRWFTAPPANPQLGLGEDVIFHQPAALPAGSNGGAPKNGPSSCLIVFLIILALSLAPTFFGLGSAVKLISARSFIS